MRTVPRVTIRPVSTEAWEAHDTKEYAVTQDPHARIHREHPELTEEAEITARFAAQMLGGTISHDPPPPDSMLGWVLRHRGATPDEIHAEFARRGLDHAGLAYGTVDDDDPRGRLDGAAE